MGTGAHAPPAGADVVVYTAINCGRDRLRPIPRCGSAAFVCFLDEPEAVPGWDVRAMQHVHRDPARATRWYKTHPATLFPHAAITIWIDGTLTPRLPADADVRELAEWLLEGAEIATPLHPERDCVYDEARACAGTWLEFADVIEAQMARYRAQGHPAHAGLYENNLLVRRATPRTAELNAAWWDEIERGSWRDQLSLPVVLRRLGVRACALPPAYGRDNPYFEFTQHAFRGHPERRREYLDHITRELGPDNPFVRHMAQDLHEVDVRQWRWQRAYDREQRRRQAGG